MPRSYYRRRAIGPMNINKNVNSIDLRHMRFYYYYSWVRAELHALHEQEENAVKDVHRVFYLMIGRAQALLDDAINFIDVARRYPDERYFKEDFMEKITNVSTLDIEVEYRGAFKFFRGLRYATHPWHHHYRILTKIPKEIDYVYFRVRRFIHENGHVIWDPHSQFPYMSWILCDTPDAEVKGTFHEAAIELNKCAKRIFSLIQPMQEGKYYSKAWAVDVALKSEEVKCTYNKAIEFMIADGRIPSTGKELLYKLIRLKKKDKFFIDDVWKAVGNNRRQSLMLAMVPLELWATTLCVKNPIELFEPPKLICLSDYFGSRKDIRIYFSPRQFPSPVNLRSGDICASFECIKVYINERTKGTVIPTGGRPGKSVIFSCKTKQCPFFFLVTWDEYGYYIEHYNFDTEQFVGCLNHEHLNIR